ncbi:MAG TPA: hypothetical protein VNK95_15850 [Caldilineaceae bacterium]|nr:hypothetical protein [Caldilineaceae bacterium]
MFAAHPISRAACRPNRAWLFALFFGLLLLASWAAQPAQAQESPTQTLPPGNGTLPPRALYLPAIQRVSPSAASPSGCPAESSNQYAATPILGSPRRSPPPPEQDPDLNLTLRGFVATSALLGLVNINGDTDPDAPQLAGLFSPRRAPVFTAAYQVHDWNWSCPNGGCRGEPLRHPEVTLVGLAARPGEPVYPPSRRAPIWGNAIAQVLFAEETRLTLAYTRDDSPAYGYVIHLENVCVDPNLLALYRSLHQAGRTSLPALRAGDPIGSARSDVIQVAVRDTGSFMDPRSRKDWWVGY